MNDRHFRIYAFSKISQGLNLLTKFVDYHLNDSINYKTSGLLTDFVKNHIEPAPTRETPSEFKAEFLKLPPGPEREKLVYNEVLKRKPFNNLVPITVPGPNGTKITYKVMPDFITIDGLRVPMAGQTAQKIANHFGMSLPTSKMTKQIWEAADTKIRPQPLSAGGRIGDRYYTGKEVVQSKIGDSDSAIAYSNMIEDALKGKNPNLIAGHMKTIVLTDRPDRLGLKGWSGNSNKWNPIQDSEHTGHDTAVHTEYGTGTRLIDNDVTITLPDGSSRKTTMDKLLADPEMYKAVADSNVKKYKT